MSTVTGRVVDVQPIGQTRNGNTTKQVTIRTAHAEEILRTAPDSSIAIAIGNAEYREHEHVFTLNGHGRIESARPVYDAEMAERLAIQADADNERDGHRG